jgi:hypothetical protein
MEANDAANGDTVSFGDGHVWIEAGDDAGH